MSTHKKSDAIYVAGDTAHERRRLQDQANLVNPFTRRLFENAGIGDGMHVLDIGSGAGDVAFLLAELVGANGTVVGVDSNPSILETARQRAEVYGYSNISFVTGDIRTIDLDRNFDAIVGRLVLLYLKNPTDALLHSMKYLKPNGIVAFTEPNLSSGPLSVPHSPLFEKFVYWILETFKRAGLEMNMGLKLRETFIGAGLSEPQFQGDLIIGGGDSWAGYQYIAALLRSLLPAMGKLGVATTAEVEIDTLADRMRNEIVSLNGAVMFAPWVSAWSRKV